MSGRSRNGGKTLKRKVGIFIPKKTLLVFCEGKRTEPEYLEALRREPSVHDIAAVDLQLDRGRGGSVPRTLVSRAIEAKTKASNTDGEIDEFWCVFDVEWPQNHPDLKEVLELARKNKVRVAISNPCFEIWLVLHHETHTGWLHSDAACRRRCNLDGTTGKGLDPAKYMRNRGLAAKRAMDLDKRHQDDGTEFPHNNPSSGMHHLLTSVETRLAE